MALMSCSPKNQAVGYAGPFFKIGFMAKRISIKTDQYYIDEFCTAPFSPEKTFCVAVLERALRDALGSSIAGVVKQQEAKVWLMSRSDHKCSAEWFAEIAGLDSLLQIFREILSGKRKTSEFLSGRWKHSGGKSIHRDCPRKNRSMGSSI